MLLHCLFVYVFSNVITRAVPAAVSRQVQLVPTDAAAILLPVR